MTSSKTLVLGALALLALIFVGAVLLGLLKQRTFLPVAPNSRVERSREPLWFAFVMLVNALIAAAAIYTLCDLAVEAS